MSDAEREPPAGAEEPGTAPARRFTVITIFPELFESILSTSVLGRARAAGRITVDFVDPRDFTHDRHRSVDDSPYGGGPGMVMKVEPLVAAIEAAAADSPTAHRILLTPAGAPLDQSRVRELAEREHLILVCGRYEGIDQRVAELAIDEQLSLGDFVLTGGELAAAAVIDAVARYLPGVLGEATSTDEESFSDGMLEYPQYTRPAEFRGLQVPEVLNSGNHARIRDWRRRRSLELTCARRPDLLARAAEDGHGLMRELAARSYVGLVHHPVYDRTGAVVTSAVTNMDIHDIARSAATYGLAGYYAITPVAAQREKIERIVSVWPEQGGRGRGPDVDGEIRRPDYRAEALALIRTAPSIAEVIAELGRDAPPPMVVTTSADRGRVGPARRLDFAGLRAEAVISDRPLLILVGTGWGLTEDVIDESYCVLEPVSGQPEFNHLCVRSALAIILDRLFGLRA